MLSPEKRELLTKLWLSGISEESIAREVGIPLKMVSTYARVLGLPPRKRSPVIRKICDQDLELIKEMWHDGATLKEIAEYFGVSVSTVQQYLRAMGLRRRVIRRCPDIPREELEKLCQEGRTDMELAEMYNTSEDCIRRLRQSYGINKRELARSRVIEERNKAIETIAGILNENGYVTSRELKERYGISATKELLRELEDVVEGFRWFRIVRTSTSKYTVFPPSFNKLVVMYLQGKERKVLGFLLSNLADSDVPLSSVKWVLKSSCAPKELVALRAKSVAQRQRFSHHNLVNK